jgi:cation transport ATPase
MQSKFRIDAMDCPTEEGIIRNRLGKVSEIQNIEFDLMNRILTVDHSFATDEPIIKALTEVGMKPAAECEVGCEPDSRNKGKQENLILGIALLLALGSELVGFATGKEKFWQVVARIIVISEIIYRFMVMPFIASLSGVAQATFLEYFMWPCFPLVSWFVYVIFLMVKCTYLYGFRSDYRAVVWATRFIIFCHFIGFIATVAAKEDLAGPWLWVNHNLHYWSWELGQKITRF